MPKGYYKNEKENGRLESYSSRPYSLISCRITMVVIHELAETVSPDSVYDSVIIFHQQYWQSLLG